MIDDAFVMNEEGQLEMFFSEDSLQLNLLEELLS